MKAIDRLLKYVSYRTPSDEESGTSPSSECQFELANALVEELLALGVEDACVDEHCYVYGHVATTPGCEELPVIGLIAHMDTVSEFCDHDATVQMIENYDGCDVKLGSSGLVLTEADFPHLRSLAGRTLITTDGTTILGADDKAGIAEIMTLIEELPASGVQHGPIAVCFTPDEEIGSGTDWFDIEKFGAAFAYTVDGDTEGEVQYECFNAASADITITGKDVHPGSAKGIMINASRVAMEFDSMIPASQRPEETEGYEGFFHLCDIEGSVGSASLSYIIRDHDKGKFSLKKEAIQEIADRLNEKYGDGTVEVSIKDSYYNMAEILTDCPEVVERACAACRAAAVEPIVEPIRGGTDGAMLSFKGLPCPNLGTAGHAFHGPYEHITAEGMDKVVEILLELVKQ